MPNKKHLTEQEIRNLEGEIPAVVVGATRAAYLQALAAGHTVVKVEGRCLVESKADGSTIVIGYVKPRRKVSVGHPIRVRRVGGSA
ncbi:hypothetical protein P3W55_15060 [Pseudomonas citronellolis]|uniref:DUF4224 domain-containing protein n=1 Tax=Pseudomonas citronellolis TaxID=53408 RepID=A0AAW6P641_9PSED|nr:hypothetical protein [Pseudomonas citronellolis]MDF3843030.1 hypothetical protein [Pseudomonas citronellolis]